MKYSSAASVTLSAIVITFLTFLGMTLLITTHQYTKSESFEPIEFSIINDMEKAHPDKPQLPKTPPKQEKVTQPPSAPNIDITESTDPNPGDRIPTGVGKPEFSDLSQFAKPTIPTSGNHLGSSQGLIALLPIMPNYPRKELNNKIEGWVKVEFIVNEMGDATQIKVIDAQPKHVFNQETIRAIRKSKFKPLMINGKAVSQTAVQIIEFKISND